MPFYIKEVLILFAFAVIIFYSNPNITGTITEGNRNLDFRATGCFLYTDSIDYWAPSVDRDGLLLKFDAAVGSPIYGKSSTVQPATLQTLIIIKA